MSENVTQASSLSSSKVPDLPPFEAFVSLPPPKNVPASSNDTSANFSMVSADNLNLDVLELIFVLLSGHDLSSVALVSRSFLAGVIPTLYKTVSYRLREGKGYDLGQSKVMSPFAVILAHPNLAVHIRNIDIQTVPITTKLKIARQPHPGFMRECTKALSICLNLTTFKCTVPNVMPSFLPSLQDKPRLRSIRLHAHLTTQQTGILTPLNKLQSLVLEFASWNVLDVLPNWVQSLKGTLTTLTLFMTAELSESTLESVLNEVSQLQGLHVVGCPKVDHVTVLRLVALTPQLESLSFTTMESFRPLLTPPSSASLHRLRHLALDTRYSMSPSPSPAILLSLMDHLQLSSCPLVSFCIKLPQRSIVIGHPFVLKLVENYGHFLKKLVFLDCAVSVESITEICKSCLHLERLHLAVPIRELNSFTASLSLSKTITTLVDVENHVTHGIRPTLNMDNVQFMMDYVGSLRMIVSDKRVWVGREDEDGDLVVSLDRRVPQGPRSLWFLPPNLT